MKGWISVSLISLAACQDVQPVPATTQVEQDVQDCVQGGNFPGRTLPPTPYFTGWLPQAGAKQMWVVHHDPRKLSETVAYLADLSVGQLVWGTRTPNQNASVLVAHIGAIPTVIGPVDPPPPPKCPGCGDGFYARRDLEFAFRVSMQGPFADAAAWPPP